jgi:hypothetical protein
MDLVEVERKLARKAGNNARGVVGRDVFSVLHYSKTHCLPDCKSRGKLKEKGVRIPGTGSVFQNGIHTV